LRPRDDSSLPPLTRLFGALHENWTLYQPVQDRRRVFENPAFRLGTTFYPELTKGSRAVGAKSQRGFSR
jgi:hypothetical protein